MWHLERNNLDTLRAAFELKSGFTSTNISLLLDTILALPSFDVLEYYTSINQAIDAQNLRCERMHHFVGHDLLHIHAVHQLKQRHFPSQKDIDALIETDFHSDCLPTLRMLDHVTLVKTSSYHLAQAFVQNNQELTDYLHNDRKIQSDIHMFLTIVQHFIEHGQFAEYERCEYDVILVDRMSHLFDEFGYVPSTLEVRVVLTVIVYAVLHAKDPDYEDEELLIHTFPFSNAEKNTADDTDYENLLEPFVRLLRWMLKFGVPCAAKWRQLLTDAPLTEELNEYFSIPHRYSRLREIIEFVSKKEHASFLYNIEMALRPSSNLQHTLVKRMKLEMSSTHNSDEEEDFNMFPLCPHLLYSIDSVQECDEMIQQYTKASAGACGLAVRYFGTWLVTFAFDPHERHLFNLREGFERWYTNLKWMLTKTTMSFAALADIERQFTEVKCMMVKMIEVCEEPSFTTTEAVDVLHQTCEMLYRMYTVKR